ncbi:MAG: glycosyltransferase family 4 protein [Verrucomicrobiota bacterium]
MAAPDANDVAGAAHRDDSQKSPVLHTAMHNLLAGLKVRDDIEVELVYGRQHPAPGENRWEGCVHYIPVSYKPFPIPLMGGPYLARTLAILRHISRTNPDIVHGQGTERESGLVAALSGKPSVLSLHGNFREISRTLKSPPWDYHWLNARLESFTVKHVHGIICISTYTKRLVSKLNSNLWTLPNAVNESFFSTSNTPEIGKIICIAGIGERKNQLNFVEAYIKTYPDTSPFRLEFVGPINPEQSYAKQFLATIKNRQDIAYLGSFGADNIPEILRSSDILLLPSIEDNCPVCILEAMASGIPVVASDVGGIPDLVIHGETGYLANANQPQKMIHYINNIIANRKLRKQLSIASQKRALSKFSAEAIANSHVEIYEAIVNQ